MNAVGGSMDEDQQTAVVQDLQRSVRNIKRTEGAVLLGTAVAGLLTCSFFAGRKLERDKAKKLERDKAKEQQPVYPATNDEGASNDEGARK